MPDKKRSRPLFLFYILVGYVLLQFGWWSYMLFDLNNEVIELKKAWVTIGAEGSEEKELMEAELTAQLKKRWNMIVGEGSVFLILLLFGGWQIRKSFKRERELNERQKNFMLSVTHELKSPIASTKLQLETLQKHELEKDKQRQIISNALEDTDRLDSLVENILLATRIESKALQVNKENINLSDLTERISSKYPRVTSTIEKNIQLTTDVDAYTSILKNLIENALKYSTGNTQVELKKTNSSIILQVTDEGVGIPEAERENIFQKFYRIGNEETRKTKGTGLGLFIVKKLVDDLSAQIQIKDNRPKGCIFEVTFNS